LRQEDNLEITPLVGDARAELEGWARSELRRLLRLDSHDSLLSELDRIGADDVRVAADLASQLPDGRSGGRIDEVLGEIRSLVTMVHEPTQRRRLFGVSRSTLPVEQRLRTAEPRISALVDELARERDDLARAALRATRLEERLASAEIGLERHVLMLRLLCDKADAAARELAAVQPERSRFLRAELTARASERARDLLTQLAVARQGRLSQALLRQGQEAMVRAVDRTRHTMLSALRTAVGVLMASEQGGRLAAGAEALDKAAARRIIETSLGDMRAAVDAERDAMVAPPSSSSRSGA
jgi:hypothetical protein